MVCCSGKHLQRALPTIIYNPGGGYLECVVPHPGMGKAIPGVGVQNLGAGMGKAIPADPPDPTPVWGEPYREHPTRTQRSDPKLNPGIWEKPYRAMARTRPKPCPGMGKAIPGTPDTVPDSAYAGRPSVIPKAKYMTLGPKFFCCSKMTITRRRKHLFQ